MSNSLSKSALERAVEIFTGQPIEYFQKTPLDKIELLAERKNGSPVRFTNDFPDIGRGTVLSDCTLSHQEVERVFDEAISS